MNIPSSAAHSTARSARPFDALYHSGHPELLRAHGAHGCNCRASHVQPLGSFSSPRPASSHARTSLPLINPPAAARRGRGSAGHTYTDPAQDAAGTLDLVSQGPQPQQAPPQPRPRRTFGPELPPPPPQCLGEPTSGSTSAAAGASGTSAPLAGGPGGAEIPFDVGPLKRRGRPPKLKAGASTRTSVGSSRPEPPPPSSIGEPESSLTSSARSVPLTVPLAEAAADLATAIAHGDSANSSTSTSGASSARTSRSRRKPFGPELPPATAADPAPSSFSSSNGGADSTALPFPLPEDPRQLNVDDILDLPLPDPRVGEPFRLDGDLSELAAQVSEQLGAELGDAAAGLEAAAAGDGGGGDVEGDDVDLDYDQLIALASRVDTSSYVARAFERAKLGLDPVTGPNLTNVEAESAGPPPPPASPPPPPPVQGAATSTGRHGGGAAASNPATSYPSSPQSVSRSDAVYVEDDVMDTTPANGDGEMSREADAAAVRRVALLVELLSASGAELEAKLEAAAPEVDPQLLALLERRYTTALKLRQDAATTERIAALYRALRYMYERRSSSPAERLLDDVLGILADAELQPDATRRRGEAAARLRNAFTGGMLDVDVFTAAAALAEGRQAAAEALAGEYVSLESFKAEAMGLLDHASRVQQQTTASLETIETEVARLRREEPEALQGREWRVRLEQVRLARQALAEREESIAALQEVLLLTRAVELQLLTGRMEGSAGGG